MIRWWTLDPLALRPRFSPGLPLSNDKVVNWLKKIKEPGFMSRPARINNNKNKDIVIFGGLAIMVRWRTLDPLALRPRFSPGLLLSDIFF
jgi:hypothetical protein